MYRLTAIEIGRNDYGMNKPQDTGLRAEMLAEVAFLKQRLADLEARLGVPSDHNSTGENAAP
jgi:hypothetical protein